MITSELGDTVCFPSGGSRNRNKKQNTLFCAETGCAACTLQALVCEMSEFFWALVDYNPTTLNLLPSMNIENPSAPAPSSGDPRDWPTILVSCSAAVYSHVRYHIVQSMLAGDAGGLVPEGFLLHRLS